MIDFSALKTIPITSVFKSISNDSVNTRGNQICPFCNSGNGPNKSPAFKLYESTNTYHCFSCNETGDVLDLVANVKDIAKDVAANFLQENYSSLIGAATVTEIEPEKSDISKIAYAIKQNSNMPALEYLEKKRGLRLDDQIKKHIYYDQINDRVVFMDRNEQVLNYRGISNSDKRNITGSRVTGSFFDATFNQESSTLFLTEGAINSLSLYSLGHSSIALFSTSNKPKQSDFLAKHLKNKKIVLAFDPDKSGESYTEHWLKRIGELDIKYSKVFKLNLPKGKDVNDLLLENRLYELLVDKQNYKLLLEPRRLQTSDIQKIYTAEFDKDGDLKGIKINYRALNRLFYELGYQRHDTDLNHTFIRNDNNVIREVNTQQMTDDLISNIEQLPTNLDSNVTTEILLEKFYKNPGQYFSDSKYALLKPINELKFIEDDKDTGYVFYENGFVSVTGNGAQLLPYSKLSGVIWDRQVTERKFKYLGIDYSENTGFFKQFVMRIANNDPIRFRSLCSICGYLIHSFYQTKLKAVVLTDSRISEGAEGRSGKTLLAKGLGKIKAYDELNGKDFDPNATFKYQSLSMQTQIVHLNDAKKKFKFDVLFNDICEGYKVERKNKAPFTLFSKMIVSTNQTIEMNGGSARDRAIEFELSEHYSESYSPEMEFGHWFFRDWNADEWSKFDNFLIACLHLFLKEGLIEAPAINLYRRKLIDETNEDFVAFMYQYYSEGTLKLKTFLNKKDIHEDFLMYYSDYKEDRILKRQGNFTKYLKKWALFTPGISVNVDEKASGKTQLICFYPE